MAGRTAVRGDQTRETVSGAAKAFTGEHPHAALHKACGFSFDIGRIARKYVRRVVDQDKYLQPINWFERHCK
jgi:hypothetical protein